MTFAMPFNHSLDDVIASPERMAKMMQCQPFGKYASAIPNMVNLHLNENLYIESVNQEIMVDVNAQGAEVRAKTVIACAFTSCVMIEPSKMILRFDHPFLFTIWLKTPDGDTLPLFIGAKR